MTLWINILTMSKKINRRYWHSKVYKQIKVGQDTVFIPVIEDLEDKHLHWHFKRAIDEQDYEYASACKIEAESRGLIFKTV